ncbi:hypothetical protein [Streptomyces sp. NBC_00342]|uniref:hypothetical protein n=1 Tax=Streptomyces sp. NBC_00342 TaxID=2975718 RepID=UPI002E281101|nr:hypothetical protein [Streptomyces sp. NBC_00342]
MTAAEYRRAAERIVNRDPLNGPPLRDTELRRAEILAQLATAAATSELADAINNTNTRA